MRIRLEKNVDDFAREIKNLSGYNLYDCYQCGKCTAGCPVSSFMDNSPTQILRLIQLNQRASVLRSQTPYVCASCNTCSSRCPMEIDIAKIMETVRILAQKGNNKLKLRAVPLFSRVFLNSVKANGRLFEFGMTINFNLFNKTPFKNAMLGPAMLKKGKLSLFPQKIKNKQRIREIFSKTGVN